MFCPKRHTVLPMFGHLPPYPSTRPNKVALALGLCLKKRHGVFFPSGCGTLIDLACNITVRTDTLGTVRGREYLRPIFYTANMQQWYAGKTLWTSTNPLYVQARPLSGSNARAPELILGVPTFSLNNSSNSPRHGFCKRIKQCRWNIFPSL